MTIIPDFEKRTTNNVDVEKVKLECGNECNVYTITDKLDLIQFIGYGKYLNRETDNVYYRGQPDSYNWRMTPSLLRKRTNIDKIVNNFRSTLNNEFLKIDAFKDYDKYTFEALLQHYGFKTTQIDCVDNIWIALWFATHKAKSIVNSGVEYVYYYENPEEYSYIFLLACDAIKIDTKKIGILNGKNTVVYDLRKLLPSYFMRPHAQHAYMIRKPNSQMEPTCKSDFSDLIIGIAKLPTALALRWLGNSEILSVETLFPSPVLDDGFSMLLKNLPNQSNSVVGEYGTIQIVHG